MLIQLLKQLQTVRQLVNGQELVRLVGLFDTSRSADDHIHTKLLKDPGLGSEGDDICRIGPGQFGQNALGFVALNRDQACDLADDLGLDRGTRMNGLHGGQKCVVAVV